ncbi:hypothetical protein fHeYen901_2 [Yersinia phage fHe-Yen9-01]|uniref:Nucleoid disruption protein n=1 Tax=Yersinia phage fHe-Yen9-01 TaxID=1965363 RepID=A0A1V0DXA2_9CAUD|nr:Ndd-like nucleoid disruption protein [Yersinia phage fHe-Yen9-01]ARB05775.1 hypothetical protein fHeYen901_2 [Yersinia phage fHe-Yen9-01]
MSKVFLSAEMLEEAGAEIIGVVSYGEWDAVVSKEITTRPGFYFMVPAGQVLPVCSARFYVGRQRSNSGFDSTLSTLRNKDTSTSRFILSRPYSFNVYFIDALKMKPLTTGFGKGQLKMIFTRSHNEEFQNLHEMNRMLNDVFFFPGQKY